jgi:hypothetical protein
MTPGAASRAATSTASRRSWAASTPRALAAEIVQLGYTVSFAPDGTREGAGTEQRMLALEAEGRDRVAPLYAREDRTSAARFVVSAELAAAEQGHDWK